MAVRTGMGLWVQGGVWDGVGNEGRKAVAACPSGAGTATGMGQWGQCCGSGDGAMGMALWRWGQCHDTGDRLAVVAGGKRDRAWCVHTQRWGALRALVVPAQTAVRGPGTGVARGQREPLPGVRRRGRR